jgi:hypothetical protein
MTMEVLLLVAEADGPEMMARIGMMRALNRRTAKATPAPGRKRAKSWQPGRKSEGLCPLSPNVDDIFC